jgi:plastocyanin
MERRRWWSVRMSEEAKQRTMKHDTRALAGYRWAVVAVGAMALLIGAHALAATPPTIEIKDFKYGPPMLSVPVGTTLTWVNHDEEPHTVTSATGAFTSAGLVNDDRFAETFTKPGTYQYFCKIHPFMKGTVVVK